MSAPNHQPAVIEVIRTICKEDQILAQDLYSAVSDLMDEGFHAETVNQIHKAFLEVKFPPIRMTQKEKEERQRHMDEAAGM